jgi:hypothetical protein
MHWYKSPTVFYWRYATRLKPTLVDIGHFLLLPLFVNQQMVKRNSNGRIVIKSYDTDVLLLSLHFYSTL